MYPWAMLRVGGVEQLPGHGGRHDAGRQLSGRGSPFDILDMAGNVGVDEQRGCPIPVRWGGRREADAEGKRIMRAGRSLRGAIAALRRPHRG